MHPRRSACSLRWQVGGQAPLNSAAWSSCFSFGSCCLFYQPHTIPATMLRNDYAGPANHNICVCCRVLSAGEVGGAASRCAHASARVPPAQARCAGEGTGQLCILVLLCPRGWFHECPLTK
jgi:hypothetical protein